MTKEEALKIFDILANEYSRKSPYTKVGYSLDAATVIKAINTVKDALK